MSSSTEPLIPVGRVARPHGVRGEVSVVPLTDYSDRFVAGARFVADTQPESTLTVASSRVHGDRVLVAFVGLEDREAAEGLRGVTLSIAAEERRPLDEDEFWTDDLEGLVVLDARGARVGVVTGVVLGAAQDRLVVTTDDGRRVDVPFVDEIVGEVHPSGGFVVIRPPDGLF